MKFDRLPTFSLFDDEDPRVPINGVARLDAPLTINSTTVYPTFRYTAGGGMVTTALWNPWGYGEALAITGAGDLPTPNSGSPLMGPLDDSVLFNAAQYYKASGTSFANITTEDFVI